MAKNEVLEQQQRFSESMIWSAQREFYDQQGVEAWIDTVPFYITSNPYIAHCYAKMIMAFIQDMCQKDAKACEDPFYIVELGTGTGQFSFYLIKTLFEYCEKLHLKNIKIHYVMTDFTESNTKFWHSHPALKPYVEKGWLDFAAFDFEHDNVIKLQESQRNLTKEDFKNPLIVIANYLFDTLTADVFSVKDNAIYESLVTLSADKENINNNRPRDWEAAKIDFTEKAIQTPYYGDKHFDEILFSYSKAFEDTHFLFPSGSLKGLRHLLELSDDRLFLISSDKGYTTVDQQDECDVPQLDFHGSFSLMANFHAIGEYFKLHQGDVCFPSERDGLVTAVFASHMQFSDMPRTKMVVEDIVEGMSPTDYFNFYENLVDNHKHAKLNMLASFLNLSRWDPSILEDISDRIEELASDADPELVSYLSRYMPKVADNFFYIPKVHDTLFDVASYYLEVDEYDKALHYFNESLKYFQPEYAHYFNMGLCCYYKDDKAQAYEYFEKAGTLQPKSKEVKKMLGECAQS